MAISNFETRWRNLEKVPYTIMDILQEWDTDYALFYRRRNHPMQRNEVIGLRDILVREVYRKHGEDSFEILAPVLEILLDFEKAAESSKRGFWITQHGHITIAHYISNFSDIPWVKEHV